MVIQRGGVTWVMTNGRTFEGLFWALIIEWSLFNFGVWISNQTDKILFGIRRIG